MSEKKKYSCWEKVSEVFENVFWMYVLVFVIFVMIAVIYCKYDIIRTSLIIECLLGLVLYAVLILENLSCKFQDQNTGSFLFYCVILPIELGLLISAIGYEFRVNLPENIKDYIKIVLRIDRAVETDITELSYKIILLMEGFFCSYWYGTKILSYDLILWISKKFLRGGKITSIVNNKQKRMICLVFTFFILIFFMVLVNKGIENCKIAFTSNVCSDIM